VAIIKTPCVRKVAECSEPLTSNQLDDLNEEIAASGARIDAAEHARIESPGSRALW